MHRSPRRISRPLSRLLLAIALASVVLLTQSAAVADPTEDPGASTILAAARAWGEPDAACTVELEPVTGRGVCEAAFVIPHDVDGIFAHVHLDLHNGYARGGPIWAVWRDGGGIARALEKCTFTATSDALEADTDVLLDAVYPLSRFDDSNTAPHDCRSSWSDRYYTGSQTLKISVEGPLHCLPAPCVVHGAFWWDTELAQH